MSGSSEEVGYEDRGERVKVLLKSSTRTGMSMDKDRHDLRFDIFDIMIGMSPAQRLARYETETKIGMSA